MVQLDIAATAACLVGLREAAACYERPAALGELAISVTPPRLPDRATVGRFAELGVDRLILYPQRHGDEDEIGRYIAAVAQ